MVAKFMIIDLKFTNAIEPTLCIAEIVDHTINEKTNTKTSGREGEIERG